MLSLNILMGQINPTVGAIEANVEKIIAIIEQEQEKHDLIVFPELAITGYPPEDLLFREALFLRVEQGLAAIKNRTKDCHVILGHPSMEHEHCFNSATVFHQGSRLAIYHKQHLPNYGVFDEMRYFSPGSAEACIFTVKGYRLGLCICEDLWQPGPVEQIRHAGADAMICINASPFDYEKPALREQLLQDYAQTGLAIIYVNQVGGQDELVFDGQSLAFDHQGKIQGRAPAFQEHLQTVSLQGQKLDSTLAPVLEQSELIYQALVCGTHDYVEKNRFPGVLLGLSGGIDSALTLAIAVDALGADRVHAVMMPSRYTADISLEDAEQQLRIMGVKSTNLSIEPAFNSFLATLAPSFQGLAADTTEENLQARIRGMLLMALSNKTGNMVLTTSNKSETAVGYATLYGDMAGGFAVLKDVLKTQVYALAAYRNRIQGVIPERVISRAPSAELAENQKDQDSLPEYSVLDSIIKGYMEENLAAADLIQQGYSVAEVNKVIRLIQRNEYKRRQAAPGVKISPRAFGKDWRCPITSGF
ncbi:Glutamine-dependent NAD(+) synthetase [Legionella massiliensis]|uniref:Glutamine-dependent NAD(+) synthetase n=1 Tax=Legionella massiliensis TaxID=1034943 RepID=A0A078L4C3_9GAMM|nr:NAD+ synthase [Legionella massiliensis]CDZ78788.1 Glutamine-dependent NAD(+) synthetase [Legionella massiliensis]CEE14526.1 Glutamine-dependent NAD(+) synthetase [Legionella massiliensis]